MISIYARPGLVIRYYESFALPRNGIQIRNVQLTRARVEGIERTAAPIIFPMRRGVAP